MGARQAGALLCVVRRRYAPCDFPVFYIVYILCYFSASIYDDSRRDAGSMLGGSMTLCSQALLEKMAVCGYVILTNDEIASIICYVRN